MHDGGVGRQYGIVFWKIEAGGDDSTQTHIEDGHLNVTVFSYDRSGGGRMDSTDV